MDDSTIQSGTTSSSAGYGPSDSDEAFDDPTPDDVRSLPDKSHGCFPLLAEPTPASPVEPAAMDEPQEEILFSSSASKRGKKMSKLSARRAVFEFD